MYVLALTGENTTKYASSFSRSFSFPTGLFFAASCTFSVTHHWKAQVRPHHRHHVSRPSLAAGETTHSVQAGHDGVQVPSLHGAVVPSRHVHSCVVYNWSSTSPFCRPSRSDNSTQSIGYGSRSFATSGPSTWNSLPLTVRDMSLTFTGFCSRLKTELYKQAYDGYTAPSRLVSIRWGEHKLIHSFISK